MDHVHGLLALTLLVSMTACPGDDGDGATDNASGEGMTEGGATEGGATEGGATEAGATEAGATEAGAESTTGGASNGGVVEACGLPTPCEPYLFPCEAASSHDNCAAYPYPDGLVCMLETLAAGEQAQLYVDYNGMSTAEAAWIDVALYGADTALYQHGGIEYSGDSPIWHSAQRCAPKPAAWFEACLADPGGLQHILCMNPYEWFEGCSEATTCL